MLKKKLYLLNLKNIKNNGSSTIISYIRKWVFMSRLHTSNNALSALQINFWKTELLILRRIPKLGGIYLLLLDRLQKWNTLSECFLNFLEITILGVVLEFQIDGNKKKIHSRVIYKIRPKLRGSLSSAKQ